MAKATKSRGWETYGIARSSASSRLAAVSDPSIFRCDILDSHALEDVFMEIKPKLVIHMAAQAFNSSSWQMEETTHRTNYLGTLNVLRLCRRMVPEAKVLLAGSSAAYGDVRREDNPLKEDCMLKPITPYGVTKAATEALGYQYYLNYSMKIYLPRLFIHVGTGHPPATAIQNFARQLALIAKGKIAPRVRVGVLTTARDFIDVRDGVDAMMTLIDKGTPGDRVNICSGKAYKISQILDMLLQISGQNPEIVSDPSLLRPSDEPLLLGDNTKIRQLGWTPKYSMKQTLEAVYEDWRERV